MEVVSLNKIVVCVPAEVLELLVVDVDGLVVGGVGATKVTFVIFPMPLVSLNVKVNLFPVEGDVKETAKFGDDCLGEQLAVDFPLILRINLQTYFLGPFSTSALKLSTYKLKGNYKRDFNFAY